MELFSIVHTPEKQKQYKLSKKAKWVTWSPEMRKFLATWSNEIKVNNVRRIYMSNKGYSHDTYSLQPKFIQNRELLSEMNLIADSFYKFKYTKDLIFFTNMIDKAITPNGLHGFLACLRELLIKKSNDRWSTIYCPINTQEPYQADFPVHSDIFIPKILFMLFVQVPTGKTGGTYLLSVEQLKKILLRTKSLPLEKRKLVLEILKRTDRKTDPYETFFNILHSEKNAWNNELKKQIEAKQEYIKFDSGQGYLIHDRLWLHGRKKSHSKMNIKRLQRFAFNTKQTIKKDNLNKNNKLS